MWKFRLRRKGKRGRFDRNRNKERLEAKRVERLEDGGEEREEGI